MFNLIRKSYCYHSLTKNDYLAVISYLAGDYELKVKHVYAKIWYDPETRQIGKKGKLARIIYMTNIGTIPDESFISVVQNGERIGNIDEEFLERMKRGDIFVLGGNKYQFLYTKGMNVYVQSAAGRKPTIPSWFSEMLPLTFDTAMAIQRFRKLVNEKFDRKVAPLEIKEFIEKHTYLDAKTAGIIYDYFRDQYDYSLIPHEGRILIEKYESDKQYLIFHTLYGRRVNDALSRAVGYLAASIRNRDIEIGINDNGFFISGEELDSERIEKAFRKLTKDNIREVLENAIDKTEVLKRRFRHCATRGLMILRNYKGNLKSVGRQQMNSHFLLAAIRKKTKDFPILKEAKREVLEDLMNIENTSKVLDMINKNDVKIVRKDCKVISPFAINLILQSHADVIRVEDKIEFIKRVYSELKRGK
jgi:ATP-dependent Lhr-like helicase